MPRQYQEHPSWPGERVPVNPRPISGGPGQRMPGAPAPVGPGVPVGPGPLGAVPVGPVSSGPALASRVRSQHQQPGLQHTGSMPPVGRHNPMTTTSTGGLPPVRPEYANGPAEVAPYSAMPYSAMPYSAMPYSAVPYSAAPYSVAPQSVAPNSALAPGSAYLQSRGARGPQPTAHTPAPKPRYRDDAYSTGARPLYSYEPPKPSYVDEGAYRDAPRDEPTYRDERPEPSYARPAYPESWGTPPPSSKPEFTSGPRARFAR
jgi:chemotaxis protein MotD